MAVYPPGSVFLMHNNQTPSREELAIAQQRIANLFKAGEQPKEKESTMLSIYKDLKEFVRENRGVIFTIVFIALLDKYLFDGALRERLKGIVNGLLGKAERLTNKD